MKMVSPSSNLLIGSYQPISAPNYFSGAIKKSIECGGNCVMFYTGSPQSTIRNKISNDKIVSFISYCKQNNFLLENVCVHAPYVINLASEDPKIIENTINVLNSEIITCQKLNINKLVVHCGNAVNKMDRNKAIENAALLINKLTNKNVNICLETMAGKGTEIGKSFEEVKEIIDHVKNKKLIGVCLDTCHISDAGYDLAKSKKIIDDFDRIIGLNYLKIIHVNDSENIVGSHKDRHANIGYGKIGFKNLLNFIYNKKLSKIIKILETPVINSPLKTYSNEIKMIKEQKFIDWIN